MHYTVMTTEDVHGCITIDLDHVGNKYLVGLYNTETKEYTHKTFDSIDEALRVYTKFVEAIARGTHSYGDRKSWLS